MNAAWMGWVALLTASLGLAALSAERLLRLYRLPARWVWAASMTASVALPLALSLRPAPVETMETAPVGTGDGWEMETVTYAATTVADAAPAETSAGGRWAGAADAALPAVWAVGSGALAVALLAAAAVLAARRRRWTPAVVAGHPVLVSPRTGPAVVGVVRPAIVLPAWALRWSEARRRLIVKHEVEHVRAGDPRLLHLGLLAVVLLPWNPGLWWQLRRLRLAVEVDCDGRTLAGEPDVAAYGSLLLEVGRMGTRGFLPAASFSEPRSFLERRIRMMTHRTPRRRAARAAASFAVLAGAAALAAALPAPPPPAALLAPLATAEAEPAAPASAAERLAAVKAALAAIPAQQPDAVRMRGDTVLPVLLNAAQVGRAVLRAYPADLRDAGVEGTAEVTLTVTADGAPADIRATSAHPALRDAGADVMRIARFRPGTVDGRPADVRITLPLRFSARATAVGGTGTSHDPPSAIAGTVSTTAASDVQVATAARTISATATGIGSSDARAATTARSISATATGVGSSDARAATTARTVSGTATGIGSSDVRAATTARTITGTATGVGSSDARAATTARSISGTAKGIGTSGARPATAARTISGTAAAGGPSDARARMTQERIASAALAAYPEALRESGADGRVRLAVRVNGEGRVTGVRVTRSEGDPAFVPVAVAAARGVPFLPSDGEPGEEIEVAVRFEGRIPMNRHTGPVTVDQDVLTVRVEMGGRSALAGRAIDRRAPEIVLEGRIRRADALVAAPRIELRRDGMSVVTMGADGKSLNVRGRILPNGEVEVTFDDGAGATATGTARPGRELSLRLTEEDLEATFTPYVVSAP